MSERIFINHTNHPSDRWTAEQRMAAEYYGRIIDIPFPAISSEESETEICVRAESMAERLLSMQPAAVLCQGEYNYTYILVDILLVKGIRVMAACSERVTQEFSDEDGQTHRHTIFQFQKFREYQKAGRV